MTPEEAMAQAEDLAQAANPHPNPRVGAVVLTPDGRVAGQGNHLGPGEAHAEVIALEGAGQDAREATLVVTLEPCVHQGRTPPCTDAILAAGIKRVVVGALDPDDRVSGGGIERLRKAGVEVTIGTGSGEGVDPAYFHQRRTGRPLITLKLAATLDGQVGAVDGTSQWITSEEARADAHRLRAQADAVVIGAGTLRSDDPQLDVRLPGFQGRQPRPVIIAGEQPLPAHAKVWDRDPLVIRPESEGRVDLKRALTEMSEAGLLSVLVEGGPTLAGELLAQGLVDRAVLYLGAKLAAGVGRSMFERPWPSLGSALTVTIDRVTNVGPDLRIDFTPR